jgi:hypothetical protein
VRYSHTDLDYNAGLAGAGNLVPFGASPLTPPIGAQTGQDLNVYSLRTQFAF